MPPPPPAHDSELDRCSQRLGLERPVLTVTGAVGLLLGSLAWVVTGQFAAAPLVFAASLTTAVALAAVLHGQASVADAQTQALAADLKAACGRLEQLRRADARPPALPDHEPDQPRDYELNDLLSQCLAARRAEARAKCVTLRTQPSDMYLAVHAAAGDLAEALSALLSDALAASARGTVVFVRTRLDFDRAVVEVERAGTRSADGFTEVAPGETRTLPFPHIAGVEGGRLTAQSLSGGGNVTALSLPFGHKAGRVPEVPADETPTAPFPPLYASREIAEPICV
ncbi:sensor histidine kinase [Alienimonas chondri]|uniref:ATP-binding protein n=1 Tax=Alienimonas chondri TaxID=2681879 RepID=A0ABX1V9I4_9PLAN|nr:sensor histidine kinase [Alienimonas chondri]NNJ24053.1 hypothetical protein [Alienimonas chondri]